MALQVDELARAPDFCSWYFSPLHPSKPGTWPVRTVRISAIPERGARLTNFPPHSCSNFFSPNITLYMIMTSILFLDLKLVSHTMLATGARRFCNTVARSLIDSALSIGPNSHPIGTPRAELGWVKPSSTSYDVTCPTEAKVLRDLPGSAL